MSEKIPELEQLRDAPEESNGYHVRPSLAAFETAYSLLDSVDLARFGTPDFTPDGDAGVDVEWMRGEYEVCLFCAASGNPQVSYRDGRYAAAPATAESLIERLEWLLSKT